MQFALSIQNIHHFQEDNQNYLLVSEENNCLSHLFVWDNNNNQFVFINSTEIGLINQVITIKLGKIVFLVMRNTVSSALCNVNGTNIWLFQERTLKRLKQLKTSKLLQNSRKPGTFYSIEHEAVVEYKITDFGRKIRKYRKWQIDGKTEYLCCYYYYYLFILDPTMNLTFVPRGLNTGLALISNDKLVKLVQDGSVTSDDVKGTLNGAIARNDSRLPLQAGNEMVVVSVGVPGKTRRLLAVAAHEKSSIKKGLDLIKVIIKMVLYNLVLKDSQKMALMHRATTAVLFFVRDKGC